MSGVEGGDVGISVLVTVGRSVCRVVVVGGLSVGLVGIEGVVGIVGIVHGLDGRVTEYVGIVGNVTGSVGLVVPSVCVFVELGISSVVVVVRKVVIADSVTEDVSGGSVTDEVAGGSVTGEVVSADGCVGHVGHVTSPFLFVHI